MSYVARLKAKIAEKPLQRELPKLPKGASVSFGSSQGEGFCRNAAGEGPMSEAPRDAIEERRAIIAECCPTPYADAFARLNHQKPFAVSVEEWERVVSDAGLFLDAWGEEAAAVGWTAGALFDVASGLVWRLGGARVEALRPRHARLGDGRAIESE